MSEINVVPLVDVTLVMLIIFMITAPAIQEWVSVRLPRATGGRSDIKEGIVISITKEGTIYFNRERVAQSDIEHRLSQLLADGSHPMFVRADREVSYGVVVDLVGKIKSLGGENVGLVVEGDGKAR
jgi:biopolymer transport protein TolR